MKVLRLPASKVQLGQPLPWNVRDESGRLLLTRGHVVHTEGQLEQILARGAFVDIEEARAVAAEEQAAAEAEKRIKPPPNLFNLWEQTTEQLKTLLEHKDSSVPFEPQLNSFVQHLLKLLDLNVDVGIFRALRQERQHLYYYGYTHAIHTAVMVTLLGRHQRWGDEHIQCMMKAALTMNLSIMDLQGQMAAQDTPMLDRQRAAIRAHPEAAVARLREWGVSNEAWLTTVLQHHEHVDGTGYPSELREVSEPAVALRVCDVFMAKISPRILRPPLTPQDATRHLYREDQGGPNSTAVVKQFGIYPPGDMVKLGSGEIAIVTQRTGNAKCPIVAAITDSTGKSIPHTVRRDTSQPWFTIAGPHVDRKLLARLVPERLYGFTALSPDAALKPPA